MYRSVIIHIKNTTTIVLTTFTAEVVYCYIFNKMILLISLMTIGTVLVVKQLTSRVAKYTSSGTQTEPGLWLPQVSMWIDSDSDVDSLSSLDISEMDFY